MPRDTRSALAGALALAALMRLPSAIPYSAGRQPSAVVVTVIDAGARYPLANADIIDLASGQHRFTDERGQARLPWPSDGQLRLRVREVGYQPVLRTLQRTAASDEATTFALSKIAYVMAGRLETTAIVLFPNPTKRTDAAVPDRAPNPGRRQALEQ